MASLLFACLFGLSAVPGDGTSVPLSEIHIRDPFVLPVAEEKKYYLFGTHKTSAADFVVYSSSDLLKWNGPFTAFAHPEGFWATRDFWAPEVHRWNGRYFMFASFKAEDAHRGTQILVSDVPQGPYRVHSDGPVTPRDWECLDGTLFVDEEKQPWIVFCHEWTQVHDGEIQAMRLSQDLAKSEGAPILLFRASEARWVRESRFGENKGNVTDGPFLHRTSGGKLLMIWSSFSKEGYALAVARSESGKIAGPWKQDEKPLFAEDGGHGMLFRRFDGQLMLSIHQPNRKHDERTKLFGVEEKGEGLGLSPWPGKP